MDVHKKHKIHTHHAMAFLYGWEFKFLLGLPFSRVNNTNLLIWSPIKGDVSQIPAWFSCFLLDWNWSTSFLQYLTKAEQNKTNTFHVLHKALLTLSVFTLCSYMAPLQSAWFPYLLFSLTNYIEHRSLQNPKTLPTVSSQSAQKEWHEEVTLQSYSVTFLWHHLHVTSGPRYNKYRVLIKHSTEFGGFWCCLHIFYWNHKDPFPPVLKKGV